MKISVTFLFLFTYYLSNGQAWPGQQAKKWTLQECILYALENNITVKNAELTKNESELTYTLSKASRLPNLTGNASQSFTFGTAIDNVTSQYISRNTNSTNFGLSSSFTLYNGNQLNNQITQNKLLLDQNSLYIKESENNIILSVTEAYIRALYSKENIVVTERNLNTSEEETVRARARYDAGTIPISDYTDAQSQAATNRYNLITAKNNYAQQLLSLKQLLELGPEDTLEIDTLKNYSDLTIIPDKISVYNKALEFLPEISAGKIGVEVSKKDLDIARGTYLPSLYLTGSIGSGYTNSVADMNFADQLDFNFNQKIGLSLSIPIFNRNQTRSQIASAKINIKKAELELQTVKKELYQKIETAWQNAISSQEQLIAAQTAREAAKESFRLARKKYELNALSTTDLVISQNTYTNSEIDYLQAKYLNLLYVQLLRFYQGDSINID